MSVAEAAQRPASKGRAVTLWLGFIIIIAAGFGLAWLGAQSVKARVVQVQTVKAGEGPLIRPEDGVLIEYEGRLENGTVFESTDGKGPVPLIAGQTVPGFTEALTRMQRGGRYRIHIPAKLAYGANPPPGAPIPPNADLEFDVHVVQIVPNAASMMQGQPQQ
ncbi:MAG TPA: FKBP-type peptidyl-prolyl cis-trans isomerase [Sphingomicrobium sp.]